jgi:hypothetical protein
MEIAVSRNLTTFSAEVSFRQLSIQERRHLFLDDMWGRWAMTVTEQNRLLVFERRVLRKIYGPTLDNDETWRIKTNEVLEILIKSKNIVRFIKSQSPTDCAASFCVI